MILRNLYSSIKPLIPSSKKKAVIVILLLTLLLSAFYFILGFRHSIPISFHRKIPPSVKISKKLFDKSSKIFREENETRVELKSEIIHFEERCLKKINQSISSSDFPKANFDFLRTEEGKNYKKILAYHNDYSMNFFLGFGHEPFEAACCKEKRCFLTDDRDRIPFQEFDAVLIHFRNFKKYNLPKERFKNQRWVFFERESPPYSSENPQDYEGVFNWTMTYRRDSDIVISYGRTYNKKNFATSDFSIFEEHSSLRSVMEKKTKMVAWFVSNCYTPSKREKYVQELQEYVQVDVYGKCGSLVCERKDSQKCFEMLEREYKFYLSFENNLCTDYVTEKFFKILSYHIVPVVRGSGDYKAIAPPHSFINVDDFNTPTDLAEYLIFLNQNDAAYVEYFRWRKNFFVMDSLSWLFHADSFCALCHKLHCDKEMKIYYNLTEWFLGKAECNKDL